MGLARTWLKLFMLVAILSLPNTRAQAQASSRPTEKVVPAPPVNPEAVVWRTAVPPVQATAGDVWVDQQGCAMAYVPAGEFVMGGPSGEGDADEQPPRQVFLEGYWIDRLLVTVAQYRQFCQATGREMPLAPDWGWYEHHPVVNVSWGEATAYAKWAGKRLPTEAEWEKAARGPEGRRFPWGDEWDPKKCSNSSNSRSTQPVGSYPSGASPYGLLDMSGNVWQWCMDWYDESYYRIAPSRNPTGPAAGRHRVLRGGSWECDKPGYFRAARRDYKHFVPDGRDNYDGFRCVIGPVTAD